MIYFNRKKYLLFFILFLTSTFSFATTSEWQILPNESTITFTGTQNNAPASGSFKKFSGEIHFDPDNPTNSKVRIIIDMNSISTTYSDFTSTLLTSDWFDVKRFPQATFESTKFTKIADKKYQADGMLTIRDKTLSIKVPFDAEELSKDKGRVKGNVTVKRTAFGVGQGEWSDTGTVKDDVQVNFTITAVKK